MEQAQDLDFSEAFDRLLVGRRLTRRGWTPTEFVVMQKGYPSGIPINPNTAEATGIPQGTRCRFSPYLMKRDADGAFAPWTPNQADLFSKKWGEYVFADGTA